MKTKTKSQTVSVLIELHDNYEGELYSVIKGIYQNTKAAEEEKVKLEDDLRQKRAEAKELYPQCPIKGVTNYDEML